MEEDDLVFALLSFTLFFTKICKCLEIVDDALITILLETPLIKFPSNLGIVGSSLRSWSSVDMLRTMTEKIFVADVRPNKSMI